MIPAVSDSDRYFSMDSLSDLERENSRPLGGAVPSFSSIAQSYSRWRGKHVARDLQKTSLRSRYSARTVARFRISSLGGAAARECAFRRHLMEHEVSQPRISYPPQSTMGRCLTIHGCPRTTGEWGVLMMRNDIISWWLPEICSLSGMVVLVIRPIFCPLRDLATRGLETSRRGTPQHAAVSASRKLSSAPESRSADVFRTSPDNSRVTGRQVRLGLEDSSCKNAH